MNSRDTVLKDITLSENEEKDIEGLRKALEKGSYKDAKNKALQLGISILNPGAGEPILGFLMGLRPVSVFFACIVAVIISWSPSIIAVFEGTFINQSISLDVVHDLLHITLIPIGVPVTLISMVLYFRKFPYIVLQLCLSNVISINNQQINEFVEENNKKFKRWYMFYIPFIIGLTLAVVNYSFFIIQQSTTWQVSPNWPYGSIAGIVDKVLFGFLFYLFSLFIIKLYYTNTVLNDLFKLDIKVQPLHPDNCGGLAPLGKLSQVLNIAVLYFGMVTASAMYILNKYYEGKSFVSFAIIIIICYVVSAAIVVFIPLLPAHKKMSQAKKDLVELINNRYEVVREEFINGIQSNVKLQQNTMDELSSLRDFHNIASSMPVYPIDTRTVAFFITSVLFPILLTILPDLLRTLGGINL